jgi:phospholipase/lecithinase/hemolysin
MVALVARRVAVVLMLILLPVGAGAATLTAEHVVVFGDSTSDTGLAFELSGGSIPPSPPYAEGRFSNDEVWPDYTQKRFEAAGGSLQNFAVGGSLATGIAQIQVAAFALTGERHADMAAVHFAGGNDIIQIADNRPRGTVGRIAATSAARLAAESVGLTARALGELGITKLAVFNAVDVGALPLYADNPVRARYASEASRDFNLQLDSVLRRLQRDGFEIAKVDVGALFRDAIATPSAYGFTNVTDPCLRADGTICDDPDSYLFWDRRHPSAAAHRFIALLLEDHLAPMGVSPVQVQIAAAPIPAPAVLLLAALAGLGLAARRRATSA